MSFVTMMPQIALPPLQTSTNAQLQPHLFVELLLMQISAGCINWWSHSPKARFWRTGSSQSRDLKIVVKAWLGWTHFAGEGNATRWIAVAERLRDTLYYKNERSMTFEIYCNKAQKMFNIFKQQQELMTDEAKVQFFLKKLNIHTSKPW